MALSVCCQIGQGPKAPQGRAEDKVSGLSGTEGKGVMVIMPQSDGGFDVTMAMNRHDRTLGLGR